MGSKVIYRAFCCHLCDKPYSEFINSTKLRTHLQEKHDVSLKAQLGKRKINKEGMVYITKTELSKFTEYNTWYMCIACSNHYIMLDNLRDHINDSHSVIVAPNEPILNLDIPDKTIKFNSAKKRKTEDEITQSIFQCTTEQESSITKSILSSFNVRSASMKIHSDQKKAIANINTSAQDLQTLLSFSNTPVTLDIEAGDKTPSIDTKSTLSMGDDYIHCCLQRTYPGILKHEKYEEINDHALSLLNQDWKRKPYIRIACGQLLAGSILVEGNQALLINCIELYNRKPSVDLHYEKFGSRFNISSIPSKNNLYNGINIISKAEDKSQKLLIGTFVFNGLVTSSVRLDKDHSPEVGASTFLFSPTNNTKVYIASRNIELANKTIDEKLETANSHDLDSQLRQVRSRLTSPRTYTCSRFFSQWTDQIGCRPYSIFTLLDKDQVDFSNDFTLASRILVSIADCMRFEKGIFKKDNLLEIVTVIQGDTTIKKIITHFINLFKEKDNLNIIGKPEVEGLLMELAGMCTQQLKSANESIKNNILDCLKGID